MNPLNRLVRIFSSSTSKPTVSTAKQFGKRWLNLLCQGIFWVWNGLFLMVVYLGFLPFIGVPLVGALVSGQVPFPFVVPLISFLAVPPICTVVGLLKLRQQPVTLMRLFYSVEAPIMALCIVRMFVLRELTPASTVMVVAGAVAIATVTLELIFGYAAYSQGLARFQMVAHTVVLIVGVYVGALLLFYTVPILWSLLVALVRLEWARSMAQQLAWMWQTYQPQTFIELIGFVATRLFQSLLFLGVWALAGFSATLFIGMPYALVVMFAQSWGRIRYGFSQQFGPISAWAITGSVVVGFGLLLGLTAPQQQVQAFELLSTPPGTVAARQALIQRSPQIRAGLLNAYLMQYRYISTWNSANNLTVWYPKVFPLTSEQASIFQTWHNALMSPFLYQGDRTDPERAAELYANFFDTPIQKAEAEAIQQALQSTVERETVEASLLNISDRVVALARQEVTVKPTGDWAEVTLYERYENSTREDQEIVYQFSLPESAVITGLWLGEADLAERYRFVVSPRGAAQTVYKQEIERAQQTRAEDPALLEQVGPRQYRLRVFPIPRRERRGQPGITHLWMTYQVAQEDGAWPLPQLTEKRNLYWTQKTERYRLGQRLKRAEDIWYEKSIPASSPAPPRVHTVALAEGYEVTATPIANAAPPPLKQQRLAVLIDTSRSMGDRTRDLTQSLQELQAIAADNTVDWFVASAAGLPAQKLSAVPQVADLSFYGSLSLIQQLQQWDTVRQESDYDAILLLTDAGNYELEADPAVLPNLPGALWLVHLGGEVPTAYPDELQQQLTDSQGGIANTAAEAISRFASEHQTNTTVMDGYQWAIAPATAVAAASTSTNFEAIAARQVIRWLSQTQDVRQNVSLLDRLHAIAKRHEVVTPYSSMLVLVNDRQREALAVAEAGSDRFDREIEDGEDVLTNPGDPLNASVPESGTPLAIFLVGTIFAWGLLRRTRKAIYR